jgi:hypothetical protein
MSAKFDPSLKRLSQLDAAIKEAKRFLERAEEAKSALLLEPDKAYSCKEIAAMKRASMDLTRALPCLRRMA